METKNLEESLGVIWHFQEQGTKNQEKICSKLKEGVNEQIFDELLNEKLIRIENGNIVFTPEGEKIASNITRRHRLAERLLNDVLEVKQGEIDKSACEFEHILSEEVTDAICTLLGHPKFCPHGSPIPAGECCKKAKEEVESIIVSLDKLSPGEKGRVAYFTTLEHPQLHKFLSLGIIPGKIIHLHQTHPAYVIKVEETQLALEENLAKNIYVRRM
ncbi:MAG TPA: hypothetical protein DHV62_07205 [Elusimicrobia bacterium]|jgi:DtxR family Mn-dependent transcriptional regulator|nr:hypothetical protein [Elusimicrobiota bacterium]